MSIHIRVASILISLSLAACSANRVGVEGYQAFAETARQEVVPSAQPYASYARCFEQNARLLPFSTVKYIAEGQEAIYELQGYGWWFETIRFAPADAGSVAEIRLAGNYDQRWEADFRRDRYAALERCAAIGR